MLLNKSNKFLSSEQISEVKDILEYQPETGKFYWKERNKKPSETEKQYNYWNRKYVGNEAGTDDGKGYIRIFLFGSQFSAHYLAWAIYYGEWPEQAIRHKNKNRSDNRIKNLVSSTGRRENIDEDHFWSCAKLNKETGCLEWQENRTKAGYGQYWVYPKMVYSHRISWEISGKRKIPSGMEICHKCDNPPCINPNHLFLGTNKDNMADMVRKGRNRSGEIRGTDHPLSKLTEDDVRYIRKNYVYGAPTDDPRSIRSMAQQFGVARSLIYRIIKKESWPHVM